MSRVPVSVLVWPTQPCMLLHLIVDVPRKLESSTATEHAQNARKRARGSSINKVDVPNGFQIIRESLEV